MCRSMCGHQQRQPLRPAIPSHCHARQRRSTIDPNLAIHSGGRHHQPDHLDEFCHQRNCLRLVAWLVQFPVAKQQPARLCPPCHPAHRPAGRTTPSPSPTPTVSPDKYTQYDFESCRAVVRVGGTPAPTPDGISDEWKISFFPAASPISWRRERERLMATVRRTGRNI